MKITPDADKGRVFDALHNPERPIYQVAHAKRPNTSEDYNSDKVRSVSDKLLSISMESARAVFHLFSARTMKR